MQTHRRETAGRGCCSVCLHARAGTSEEVLVGGLQVGVGVFVSQMFPTQIFCARHDRTIVSCEHKRVRARVLVSVRARALAGEGGSSRAGRKWGAAATGGGTGKCEFLGFGFHLVNVKPVLLHEGCILRLQALAASQRLSAGVSQRPHVRWPARAHESIQTRKRQGEATLAQHHTHTPHTHTTHPRASTQSSGGRTARTRVSPASLPPSRALACLAGAGRLAGGREGCSRTLATACSGCYMNAWCKL